MIVEMDISILEILNALNVWNYVKLVTTPILVLHAKMNQTEKEKIAIVWMDSMMMEPIFAKNAQNIVILVLTNMINVCPVQLIPIGKVVIAIVLMDFLIMVT